MSSTTQKNAVAIEKYFDEQSNFLKYEEKKSTETAKVFIKNKQTHQQKIADMLTAQLETYPQILRQISKKQHDYSKIIILVVGLTLVIGLGITAGVLGGNIVEGFAETIAVSFVAGIAILVSSAQHFLQNQAQKKIVDQIKSYIQERKTADGLTIFHQKKIDEDIQDFLKNQKEQQNIEYTEIYNTIQKIKEELGQDLTPEIIATLTHKLTKIVKENNIDSHLRIALAASSSVQTLWERDIYRDGFLGILCLLPSIALIFERDQVSRDQNIATNTRDGATIFFQITTAFAALFTVARLWSRERDPLSELTAPNMAPTTRSRSNTMQPNPPSEPFSVSALVNHNPILSTLATTNLQQVVLNMNNPNNPNTLTSSSSRKNSITSI